MSLAITISKSLFTSSFNMKLFLKHILVFSVIFFFAEKSIWFILNETPNKEYDKRLEKLLKGQVNKDVIVLGSSKGAGNILAGQLQSKTNFSCYNLSYQGSNVNFHYFILKTLLKYNEAPKYVILNIDDESQFVKTKTLNFRDDALFPLTKYDYVNNELITQKKVSPLARFLLLSRYSSYHSVFRTVFKNKINPLDSFGSMGIISNKSSTHKFEFKKEKYDKILEDSKLLESFKEIQVICDLNDINLLFVFSPRLRAFNDSFYNRFIKMINNEKNIFVYDTLNLIYENPLYYRDSSHLLKNGAEIFTSEISDFINSNK